MELIVEVSPYSMPKAAVGRYEKAKGSFLIEFRYIDNEPASRNPRSINGVVIREGKYSRKILSISIPIDEPHLSKIGFISLQTKIAQAFRERVKDVVDPDSPKGPDVLNQEVAEEILDEATLKELTAELVG
ncbi:hypothetical protein [Planctomyces sp. SH-PL62]|uniref:hypothetical protein n=1 Tax=Planctomyces sp. SH-PL62 TaxID=1636152 RepID=UPI0012E7704C|nr:hypothetical protein [Planctomyces sp. SH-PL62]